MNNEGNGAVPPSVRSAFSLPSESRHGDMGDQAAFSSSLDVPTRRAQLTSAEMTQRVEFEARYAMGEERLCKDCGDEIPLKRREAVPNATRCRDCQETFEHEKSLRRRH